MNRNANHRERWWFLIAILFLTVGTIVGLTAQQRNFDDHERLDDQTCELALQNRKLIDSTLTGFIENPDVPESIRQTATIELDRIRTAEHQLSCSS